MTRAEFQETILGLRMMVTNVLGFHEFAESEGNSPQQQLKYDAYVYAGGVQLAHEVLKFLYALEDDRK